MFDEQAKEVEVSIFKALGSSQSPEVLGQNCISKGYDQKTNLKGLMESFDPIDKRSFISEASDEFVRATSAQDEIVH